MDDGNSLENAAKIIAELLDQLTHDRYTREHTKMSEKNIPIAQVFPREEYVRIDVQGQVLKELDDALDDAGLDLREFPNSAPKGTTLLAPHRRTVSLHIHTREEAIGLASALVKIASQELVNGYLKDPVATFHDFKTNPELIAHMAAAMIAEIRDKATELGAGNILDALEDRDTPRRSGKTGRKDL